MSDILFAIVNQSLSQAFTDSIEIYSFGILMLSWKVLKCGAGEGWRRSVGSIV
jgi:hypothetical protein